MEMLVFRASNNPEFVDFSELEDLLVVDNAYWRKKFKDHFDDLYLTLDYLLKQYASNEEFLTIVTSDPCLSRSNYVSTQILCKSGQSPSGGVLFSL